MFDGETPPRASRARFVMLPFVLALMACGAPPAPTPAAPEPPPVASAAPPPAASAAPPPIASAAPTAAPAAPAPAPRLPVLKAVDVYGTDRIDGAWVRQRFGEKFQRWFDSQDEEESNRLEKEMVDAILAEHKDLGWVELRQINYYDRGDIPQGYVTIDVVERKDMKARLTFGPAPKGDFEDPDGLLAAWKEYESTYFSMMRAGEIGPQRVECPAYHCMGGYEHEKLKPYGEKFVKGVPPNEEKLTRILREDKDPKDRAAAAFLLAHIKDGKKLVALMIPLIRDPDMLVRNNAMRVLLNVAWFHHEVPVPLDPVLIAALDGPGTTDRNKAVGALWALLDRPDGAKLYPEVIRKAGPTLLKLYALEQPNNHDFAYKILKKISGKDLGERDVAAWKQWLEEQRGKKKAGG
jgi:hypothetical protein